ncbi:MAG: FadR/GntR family transcriptional regulator [Lachnospiraceae bacterium]|nr:FadR/GntR family transcriptional regulator [Lachnospiraceae bacterium]MDD3616761.1 FadR/GntR family transcriptional regulator [Lachnospiraceae bacterium]
MGLSSIHDNNKPLPELVAEQIEALITDEELASGDKLPNEFQMAEELNVGRGTIREAVKILVSKNVLEIQRGRGTFVCEKTGMMDDPLGLKFIKDKNKLALDLCEVRMILEPDIAALAAKRASARDVQKIEKAAKEVEDMIAQGEPYAKADVYFHERIAKASKNQVVPKVIPVIQTAIEMFIDVTSARLTGQTIRTHRAVVEAIREHDEEKAREAMFGHLRYNKEHIEMTIAELEKEK